MGCLGLQLWEFQGATGILIQRVPGRLEDLPGTVLLHDAQALPHLQLNAQVRDAFY